MVRAWLSQIYFTGEKVKCGYEYTPVSDLESHSHVNTILTDSNKFQYGVVETFSLVCSDTTSPSDCLWLNDNDCSSAIRFIVRGEGGGVWLLHWSEVLSRDKHSPHLSPLTTWRWLSSRSQHRTMSTLNRSGGWETISPFLFVKSCPSFVFVGTFWLGVRGRAGKAGDWTGLLCWK